MFADPGAIWAPQPQVKDADGLRKTVTDWLASRPNPSRVSTLESITQAFKTLYPCH
jgi:hypothetical protein